MPRLSLYRPNKQNDYRFMDRTISDMLTAGGTDLYIHKYLGPTDQGPSTDPTQPQYAVQSPTNIQDLLFMENRDRTYDPNIYRLRGHYNVQNLDFDLSQFGLFLNNDIIFVTVHYNDMIDIIGRKLMVGDVLELPHLLDYNPLDQTIPVALKRFMQITDANYASEGFTQTWYPHLWRIKCEPLVNSEEFSDILTQPVNQDNYLGNWDKNKDYPAGYTITFGGLIYKSLQPVPPGTYPPNPMYWELESKGGLADIISTYNKNIAINDAVLADAEINVPHSGYDQSQLYVVPSYGEYITNQEGRTVPSGKINQPAPPIGVLAPNPFANFQAHSLQAQIVVYRNNKYKNPSVGIKISKDALAKLQEMNGVGSFVENKIDKLVQAQLSLAEQEPEKIGNGSGRVDKIKILKVETISPIIIGPYGTADNTYATADQDPSLPSFTGTVTSVMDFRADCDPTFQYISRSAPRSFGYTTGYMTGDGSAPNGFPTGAGISFPTNPAVGDYFLRIDYLPQLLYRWDGKLWIQISQNVRTQTGFGSVENQSQLSSFINNDAKIYVNNDNAVIPQAQPLSNVLQKSISPLPPI